MRTSIPVDRMQRILQVDSTSRVGRLVLHNWRATPPVCLEIIEQHRDLDRDGGLFWPLQEPSNDRLVAQRVDAIVCLAGVTPGPGADLSQNVLLAETVLGAAHRAGVGRVLLASSPAIYGAANGTPFSEADATVPVNAYGRAKLEMEQACVPWREAGLEVCCLRIGNVAGADALLFNVVRAWAEQPLSIDRFPDGRGPVRSYIGAAMLAEVLSNLATHSDPLPHLLNIAVPGVVFMEDLARAADHHYAFRTAPVVAHQRITLDCHRLAVRHPFSQTPPIQCGW